MEIIITIFLITYIWVLIVEEFGTTNKFRKAIEEQLKARKANTKFSPQAFDELVNGPITKPNKLYKWKTKNDYLHSPEWQAKRKQRLAIDNYICQGCGKDNIPLEIHHINYDTLYNEDINFLVSVCRDCHQAIHDKYGYKGNYFPVVHQK